MTHTEILPAGNQDFAITMRGSAWQPCDLLDAVDGTIEIAASASGRTIIGLIHGRLVRPTPGGPFAVSFSRGQLREMIDAALEDWAKEQPDEGSIAGYETAYRVHEARWWMTDCPVPFTAAPRYTGGAQDVLRQELGVAWENWMQD